MAAPRRGDDNAHVSRSVLIVDDHAAFRAGARRLLEEEGYDVVGEAVDGASALSSAQELRPDVVLLDVHLPDLDGFEVASRLTAGQPAPSVVLTSSREVSDFGPRLPTCGACGFVPKDELCGSALAAVLP